MPTNKQRRILEDARATLERHPEPAGEQRHPATDEQRRIIEDARATLRRQPEPVEPVRYKTHYPAPSEPEVVPAAPQPEAPAPVDWAGYVEQRLEQEREFTIAVIAEVVAKAKAERKKEAVALTLEITRLKCVCDELRIALGAERRGTVLDLPALPRRVN
jgi:hypothetical protein